MHALVVRVAYTVLHLLSPLYGGGSRKPFATDGVLERAGSMAIAQNNRVGKSERVGPGAVFLQDYNLRTPRKGDNQRTNQNDLDIALSWPQRTAIEKIDCLNLHPGRTAPKTIAQNPISVHESHKPPSSLPTAPCLPSLRPTAGTALGDLTSAFEHEVSSPSVPATPAPAWNLRDALRGGHQDFTVPDVRILNVEYLLAVFRHLQLSFCEILPSVASREMRNSNTSGP